MTNKPWSYRKRDQNKSLHLRPTCHGVEENETKPISDQLALEAWEWKKNLGFYKTVRRFLQIHSEAGHSNRTKTCQGLISERRLGWARQGWLASNFQVISDIYIWYISCAILDISDKYLHCPVRYIWYILCSIRYIPFVENKIMSFFIIIQMFGFVHIIITRVARSRQSYIWGSRLTPAWDTLSIFTRMSRNKNAKENKQKDI